MSQQRTDAKTYRINLFSTFIGWTFGVPWTILIALSALLVFAIVRKGHVVHSHSKVWARGLLKLTGISVKIHGLEQIPKDQPVLIVANHQSMCDILALAGYLPIPFSWIAKKELFKIPIFGTAMTAAKYIPIDRKNRENAYKTLDLAADVLQSQSVLIFPEGTRSRTGEVRKFKYGAAHIIMNSNQPVLPIAITNSFERMPPDRMGILPGNIQVRILPIISTEGLDRRKSVLLLSRLQQEISAIVAES
ncbi:1-acyl-sn-glycerol-3-phosphate acyltransferase [bacterium]|nr:1-acyl-sn-glycerol-3-phosphate acyltransferase [candidate division CSSED10-310 bacterium]